MSLLCIENGKLWDGERFSHANVLVNEETGLVEHIGPERQRAETVFDASGAIVSAGLVDAHVHLWGVSSDRYGMQAEMACLPFGATACADAGAEKEGAQRLDCAAVRSCVFVPVEIRKNTPDLLAAEKLLCHYGSRAIGLKVYFDTTVSDVWDATALKAVCAFAHTRGLRVMVHCSHAPVAMWELLSELGAGDILTHIYHGGENSAAEDDFASLLRAQQRGVILDSGNAGNVHTDFAMMRAGIARGVLPNTISSDITRLSAFRRGGIYGLTLCMSMFRTLDVPEDVIFRAVTSSAAAALGQADWGSLRAGARADIAVLRYGYQPYRLEDAAGNVLEDRNGYSCCLTIVNGQLLYRVL